MERKNILSIPVIIVIGIALLLFVLLIGFRGNKKAGCVQEVQATVVRMDRFEGGSSRHHSTSYAPVYAFTYQSKQYEVKSRFYTNMESYHEGSRVTLYINPNNPYEFTDPARDKRNKGFTLGFFLCVFLFIAVWAGLLIYGLTHSAKSAYEWEEKAAQIKQAAEDDWPGGNSGGSSI